MTTNIIKSKFPIFWIIFIFIIAFNYLSFNFFIKNFISLENNENDKTLSSLISNIDSRINTTLISTNDYSHWDNTYEFIDNKNKEYIYENFRDTATTIENLKLNFMIFMNSKNENIHTQITENLNIKNKNEFIKYIGDSLKEDEYSSIIKYKEKYYYLVKSKISRSDLSGEFRGYIYSGRIFDLETFDDNYKNNIKIIDSTLLPPLKIDSTLKSKFINKIELSSDYKNDILSNIISLKNNKQNLITLKFDSYREIYKEGKKQIILFNIIVSTFILILFFVFYLYLYQHQKLYIQLEKRVKEEIDKQKIQEEMLIRQARSAEIGEMINNIAHQWRQPLNNLSLVIQNINFTYQSGDLDQKSLEASVNQSKNIIKAMSNTIDTFKDFFKPNKNKNLFNLEHSIDNTLEIMSSTLKFHNIKLIKEIHEDILLFDYENEFSQVLLNIITNAKDVLVSNEIKNPEIKISISKVKNNAIINIQDNANGIDEKIINKIFESYFTTKGKGTGIGLYMTKIIIEKNMKGSINVKNEQNGAIFTISLPITTK